MSNKDFIYFDNAATSFPKPQETIKAMVDFMENIGANPGRSGHRLSVEAGRIIEEARANLAELFNINNPLQISFTHNATYAINFALLGLLSPGDHCITTSLEHNSVARPLRYLESLGVEITIIEADKETSNINPEDIRNSIKENTKLVVLLHGSNVTGKILPIKEIGKITKEHDVLLLVDSAQTAGCVSIDVETMNIDLLAFTGHKSLFGPMGTGGLYIREGIEINTTIRGGTGSKSEEDIHPTFFPDSLEAGTANASGLAGLKAGIQFIQQEGLKTINEKEISLLDFLLMNLKEIPDIVIHGLPEVETNLPVVSFNIKSIDASKIGDFLDREYNIMCRVGLHCSPWAHQTLGTASEGTVRVSLSYFNKDEEIDILIKALKEVKR